MFVSFLLSSALQIAQYLVVRSRTAEEVYADVWEVVNDMADRAANHGCSIPTEGTLYTGLHSSMWQFSGG